MKWKQVCAAAVLVALGAGANAPHAQAQDEAQSQNEAQAPAPRQLAEGVVAIVNDDVISTYDVRQRANLLLVSSGIQPTQEILERAQQQALRSLVDESLQMQETAEYEITISEDSINQRIMDIAASNQTTLEEFARQLSASGVGLSTLRRQIRADMAWNRLMSGLYRSRIRISDQQVRDTRERLALSATRPHYLVSEIYLPAESPDQVQDLQRGAFSLLQQMQQGVPFPMVARQFSAAPSAAAGGDIGWIAAGELPSEVDTVLTALQPGQVSTPIATENGVYIVALRDMRQGVSAASISQVALRQISAPASEQSALERAASRISGCGDIEDRISSVAGAQTVDLGQTMESELSDAIRSRISSTAEGSATPVIVNGDTASALVVCAREAGGADLPSPEQLENQLFEREMSLLSERYLRNLRREATIITR